MEIYVKKILIPGFSLIAKLKNKLYHCKVCKDKQDVGFLVQLSKPDQLAFTIMDNTTCTVQFVTDDGYVCKFESRVLSRLLPRLRLSYPTTPPDGISVRKQERVSVSFWTTILGTITENGMQKLKPVGDGSIVDINLDGCKFMTNVPYKVKDTIFLSFEYDEEKDPISFDGIVRRVSPAPHGLKYYGVQYEEPDSELLETVQIILKNPDI